MSTEHVSEWSPAPRPFPWERASLALGLLAGSGASAALFVTLVSLPGIGPFVTKNTLGATERQWLLGAILGGAVGALLGGLGWLGRRGRGGLDGLERMAHFASPLLLLSGVPALAVYATWHREPMTFLVLLSLLVLGAERLLTMSIEAAPAWLTSEARPGARRWARWLPVAAVVVGALGYTIAAGYYSVVFHRKLQTAGFDLGIYDNLMYNALHGQFFRSPVLFGAKGGNYLAGHAEFGMLLFLPLYALWPSAEMLLWLQAALFGFAAVPLYRFASTQVPRRTAALVALAYLLYAPLHGPNFYDFHWLPCAIFFHFWLYDSLARERYKTAWALVLVLFSIREDVAVGLAVLGVVLVLTGKRVRFGLWLAPLSVLWFVIDKFVIMRWAGTWWFANIYKDLMAPGENGYGSIIKTILINPVYFLSTLLKQDKLEYTLHLLAPLAFLPVRRPVLLLLAIPGFFFTLMSTGYGPTVSIAFQYTSHWIPYLFAAAVMALHLREQGPGGIARRQASTAALLLGVVAHSYVFGFVLQREVFVGGFQRLEFTYSQTDRARFQGLRRLVARIPRQASVAATENENPHISNRMTAYTLRDHHGDAEYLLIGRNKAGFGNTRNTLKDAFERNRYGLLDKDEHFYLFKRDHESPDTEAAVSALGLPAPKTP